MSDVDRYAQSSATHSKIPSPGVVHGDARGWCTLVALRRLLRWTCLALGCGASEQALRDGDPLAQCRRDASACAALCPTATACFELAGAHADDRGGAQDLELAARLYEHACEAGHGAGCTQLAILREPDDPIAARRLHARGCADDDPSACRNSGVAMQRGVGAPPDAAAAAIAYGRACELGDGPGCTFLANLLDQGEGVPRDGVRALVHFELACDRGDAQGCHNAGTKLRDGRDVAVDRRRALDHSDRGCALGSGAACFDAALDYGRPDAVVPDRARAEERVRQACELGFDPACDLARAADR